MRYYNIHYHIYADDTQLYCYFDIKSPMEALNSIRSCIADIRTWMIKKKLKINDDKTEFLIITSPRANFTDEIILSIGQEVISPSSSCKSLGVMFDQHFMMDTFFSHELVVCVAQYMCYCQVVITVRVLRFQSKPKVFLHHAGETAGK